MRRRPTAALARRAAIRLTLSVALILGGTCLLLRSTISNEARPQPMEPFYTDMPGVDLGGLSPSRKEALLKRLNVQRCPCDCSRSVASCRKHHGCWLSLAAARDAVAAAAR